VTDYATAYIDGINNMYPTHRYGSEAFPLEMLENKYNPSSSNILNNITAKVFSR